MSIQKKQTLSKLYTLLVVFLPVLSTYAAPGLGTAVSLGELLLLLIVPLLILRIFCGTQKMTRTRNVFYIYFFYAIVLTIETSLFFVAKSKDYTMRDSIVRLIRDAFYIALVFLFGKYFFDIDLGLRLFNLLAVALSAFIIVQFCLYFFSGIYLPGVLPNANLTVSGGIQGWELNNLFLRHAMQDGYVRANGFMAEPAIAAQFLAVALLSAMFPINKTTDVKLACLYSMGLLLTFSANAFVALMVCWILWLLKAKKDEKIMLCIAISFIVAIFLFPVILDNQFIGDVINRLLNIFDSGNTQNSAAVRVIRGFAFFLEMPIFFQIFGIGFGNFIGFKSIYGITTIYEQETEYLNTNAYIAISTGIIGLVLFVVAILKGTKEKPFLAKAIAIILFTFGFSSSIYSTGIFVIMLLFIFGLPNINNKLLKSKMEIKND